ncbi:MAG: glucan biosynthesis protein G [Acetobacteraceae bacterium]|nr:glucan biosynthesis protein G [Acetobacteraceae bacterium]
MRRRELLGAGASVPLLATLVRPAVSANDAVAQTPFTADTVTASARSLAQQPFKAPDITLPKELANLDYAQYRSIRFDPAHALWAGQGLNFTAQFAPRGFLFKGRVDIFEVANGQATPVRYSSDQFSWKNLKPPTDDLGFAGFRVHYPLNRLDYFDEIFAFLGASYFRAVARGQGYGLSARGLAIKTADRAGEEFPFFQSFWLERPAQGANAITVHALLNSPSTTAAFRFAIRPGQATVFDTEATIFPRVDIALSGLAPLTSMFFFDASDRVGVDDWRAAVHDSDSLVLRTGHDERILRSLSNPRTLQISTFSDSGPRGFGLTQRRREFIDYQDLEARYEKRPSLWVEPVGDWGQGVVELVEIPSGQESNDNIVTFWRPHDPLKAKGEFKLAYRLFWGWSEPEPGPVARVLQTRSGASADGKHRQFVIDFAGAPLDALTAQTPPALDVGTDKGKIVNVVAEQNPDIHGWRVSIELDPQGQTVVEMHARLMRDKTPLSETWIARWTPS